MNMLPSRPRSGSTLDIVTKPAIRLPKVAKPVTMTSTKKSVLSAMGGYTSDAATRNPFQGPYRLLSAPSVIVARGAVSQWVVAVRARGRLGRNTKSHAGQHNA